MNQPMSVVVACGAACALVFACSSDKDEGTSKASKGKGKIYTSKDSKPSPVKMQCKKIIELAEAEGKKTRDPKRAGKDEDVRRAKAQAAFISACETKFDQKKRDCLMTAISAKDLKAFRACMVGTALVNGGKTTEARRFVKKIYDGARTYFLDQHASRGLKPLPSQFPGPSQPPTPALGTCCKAGGKCAPGQAIWSSATWIALGFSVDDPHYFSYSYTVKGKSFTARAFGDLDCDGKYSTFELRGSADAKVPAKLTVKDELE